MALNGRADRAEWCLLLGEDRTHRRRASTSASDPKRAFTCHQAAPTTQWQARREKRTGMPVPWSVSATAACAETTLPVARRISPHHAQGLRPPPPEFQTWTGSRRRPRRI